FILSPTRPDAPLLGIPPPLPTSVPASSLPLLLPSASRREDLPEVTLPPGKRLGIALGPGYEVGESSSVVAARLAGGLRVDYGFVATMDREMRRDPKREIRYGITDSWDEIVETLQGAPVSTDIELGRHMTAYETRVRQDTNEVYTRLEDEQILAQMSEIRELHAADRRRQAVISEMLKVDQRRSAEMRELRTADHTRQHLPESEPAILSAESAAICLFESDVHCLSESVTACLNLHPSASTLINLCICVILCSAPASV
ncbi:hypothetical protein Tco_1060710, partial [Tanacetum coccineum]